MLKIVKGEGKGEQELVHQILGHSSKSEIFQSLGRKVED